MADNAIKDRLRAVHGDGVCHICGELKRSEGKLTCSYPHQCLPVGCAGGFFTWEDPTDATARRRPLEAAAIASMTDEQRTRMLAAMVRGFLSLNPTVAQDARQDRAAQSRHVTPLGRSDDSELRAAVASAISQFNERAGRLVKAAYESSAVSSVIVLDSVDQLHAMTEALGRALDPASAPAPAPVEPAVAPEPPEHDPA